MRTVICKHGSGCQKLAEDIHGEKWCDERCGREKAGKAYTFMELDWTECIRLENEWRKSLKKADREACQNFSTAPA